MLPSFMKQLFAILLRPRAGTAALWEGKRLPGGLFAQTRCARHIDATARRVALLGHKITTMSKRLHAGGVPGQVDADRCLRCMLDELKEDLCSMRRELASWRAGTAASAPGAPARAWKRRLRG